MNFPFRKRLQKLKQFLAKDEGLLIIHWHNEDPWLYYFTGYKGYGSLVKNKQGRFFLYVPAMEYLRAKQESIVPVKIIPSMKEVLKGLPKTLAIIEEQLSWQFAKGLQKAKKQLTSIDKKVWELRIQKDAQEQYAIMQACKKTDTIFAALKKLIPHLSTEEAIKHALLKLMAEQGLTPSFPPIVTNAKNTAIIHTEPSKKRITKGFLLIDFGVFYKGYASDMTRMFYKGNPSKEEREHFSLLKKIQEETIKSIKPGIPLQTLEKEVRKKLGQLRKYFPHSLGHGVGLEIHELPRFDTTILKEGMVITIEPGIYLPKHYGIRIEDTILVTKTQAKVLTKSPKTLTIIK